MEDRIENPIRRLFLITHQKKANWEQIELSVDQKPENPLEKERIIKAGGRVEQYRDDAGTLVGPYRVWKKTE